MRNSRHFLNCLAARGVGGERFQRFLDTRQVGTDFGGYHAQQLFEFGLGKFGLADLDAVAGRRLSTVFVQGAQPMDAVFDRAAPLVRRVRDFGARGSSAKRLGRAWRWLGL